MMQCLAWRHRAATRLIRLAVALAPLAIASHAQAAVYLTGSVSTSTINAGLQSHESVGGSGSIAIDLGSYLRLGFTHKEQVQTSSGWTGKEETDCVYPDNLGTCVDYSSKANIKSNSVDLTVILYEGDVIVPFIMGGAIVKTYKFQTIKGDEITESHDTSPPKPNVGAGLGIRLNKEFSLKLMFTASPGGIYTLDGQQKSVWDKDTSIGLTYQL